uniref:Uncharacterized protein n=1 Tax=Cacopsylla melanoneura TaxID=428564 RepID=A0A8D8LM33_9HEMI
MRFLLFNKSNVSLIGFIFKLFFVVFKDFVVVFFYGYCSEIHFFPRYFSAFILCLFFNVKVFFSKLYTFFLNFFVIFFIFQFVFFGFLFFNDLFDVFVIVDFDFEYRVLSRFRCRCLRGDTGGV